MILCKDQQNGKTFSWTDEGKNREDSNYQNQKWKYEHYFKLYSYRMIIMEYCEKLYANKLDNLVEMDKFLERCKLLKLIQKEIEYLSRPITSK